MDVNTAVLEMLAFAALADDQVEDSEIQAALDAHRRLTGRDLDRARFLVAIDSVRQRPPEALITFLDQVRTLRPAERETVLTAGVRVARADGHLAAGEIYVLGQVAQALDIDRARFNTLLAAIDA